MQKNYRVNLGFARYPDPALYGFAGSINSGMTGNPAFPAPPLDPATGYTPIVAAFYTAWIAAEPGGKVLTAAKVAAYDVLVSATRKQAGYVQIMAGNDIVALLSSGFLANSTNRARTPLDTPGIAGADNSISGQLTLRLVGVNNAVAYEVQTKIGAGAWTPAGTFTQSRNIVLPGLTPGVIYTLQVRGVGGSTGYSPWSLPTSIMAT